MSAADSVLSSFRASTSTLLETLIEWANQNSGSDHAAGLERMAGLLEIAFGEFGPVEKVYASPAARAPILRITLNPQARPRILFSGHYDTVYGAGHPFQTCRRADSKSLNGPGVADMKGGLVVVLAALRHAKTTPAWNRFGGQILLTPDEETGSETSRRELELAARESDFALVFEPARENGNLVRARMGVGTMRVVCRGTSAHAGKARTEGKNAIVALARWIGEIDRLARENPHVVVNVGRIDGGGAVNVVPELASASLNVRASSHSAAENLQALFRVIAENVSRDHGVLFGFEGGFGRPPKEVDARDEELFQQWQRCATALGVAIDWQDTAGGSDGNIIRAQGIPTLDGLGPVGGSLHSDDEYILLDSLAERAAIAARFLCGL